MKAYKKVMKGEHEVVHLNEFYAYLFIRYFDLLVCSVMFNIFFMHVNIVYRSWWLIAEWLRMIAHSRINLHNPATHTAAALHR